MISGKKKGLGRGLSALFGDDKPKVKPSEFSIDKVKGTDITLIKLVIYIGKL